jgi:hypothetical protein
MAISRMIEIVVNRAAKVHIWVARDTVNLQAVASAFDALMLSA